MKRLKQKLKELAINMISKINSTPINELPDSSLHTEMINLQQDVNEHLSEKSIYDQIEEFKSTMKVTQGVTVSTTHRNAIIQAEIETKDEYLRLNQGSGESVLDTTSKDKGTSSGLIERDIIVNKTPQKTDEQSKRKENSFIDSTRLSQNSDFKMKSKFEGMKGFVAPKTKKEKRIPDENSSLEQVRNSVSVNLMKESSNIPDDDILNNNDNDDDDNDNNDSKKSDKQDKNNSSNVKADKTDQKDVTNEIKTEISEADLLIRKQQQLERLERIANMKGKEYLIGWG